MAGAANAADQAYQFDIPAEPLGQALTDFSQATSKQLILSEGLVKGRQFGGLHGRYTIAEALQLLLAGTGLHVENNANGTLMIKGKQVSDAGTASAEGGHGGESSLETVVITGSHLSQDYAASTPVRSLNMDKALAAGISGTQALIQMSPAASGTQQVNNMLSATGAGGSVSTGGMNSNTIALRNLGAMRTLTLLNGRRLTPAGVGSQVGPVDLNVVPSSIIDHVDVLTDGASSVYGSDAVAGVINIIPRKESNGLELRASGAVPQHGGGESMSASLFWGQNYGRGYVNVAGEYDQQIRLKVKDRPETSCAQNYVYSPTTGARVDLLDTSGNYKCRNTNPTGVFFDESWYGGWFQYDPNLSKANYPAAALTLRSALPNWVRTARAGYPDTFTYGTSDSSAYQNADSISPYKRASLYASGGYKFSDKMEAYGDLLLNMRSSSSTTWMFLYPDLSPQNPNNTVAASLKSASGGNSNGWVMPQMNMPLTMHQNVNYLQATAGLRGTFAEDSFLSGWSWDQSVQYGRSFGIYSQNFFYADRVNASSLSNVACDSSYIVVSGPTACVSIPWLDPKFLVDQNWTKEQRDFLEGNEKGTTSYDMTSLDGLMRGSLFDLPAGKVEAALGYSVRFENMNDTPGANAQAHNYFAFSTAGVTKGANTAGEVFGEIGVPVLADLPFAYRLNVTGSARFTGNTSYGTGTTYKIGGTWEIIPSLGLRTTYGTSYRAPSLYELYLANQTSFYSYTDPCQRWADNSSAVLQSRCASESIPNDFTTTMSSIVATQGGGAGSLKAETSNNLTYGVQYRPEFANLQINVDYYDIGVHNEVATYGVSSIINQCYNRTTGYQAFCSKIKRNSSTHVIESVDNRMINIASERRRGIDLDANYGVETPFAYLNFNTQWSWTLQSDLVRDSVSGTQNLNGLSGHPQVTGMGEVSAKHGAWTFYYGFNFIGGTNDANDTYDHAQGNIFNYYGAYAGRTIYGNSSNYLTVAELLRVPAYMTHYISGAWQMDDDTYLQFGVRNLFDKHPPVEGSDSFTYRIGSVPSNLYDLTGRTFFMNIKRNI